MPASSRRPLTAILQVNMLDKTIKIPKDLFFENTIKFVRSFTSLNEEGKFIFDFQNTRRIDPFSLLYLSSELDIFKKRKTNSIFFAKHFEHLSYLAHMGFFKSFGLDFGKEPGEARGSQSYYPIKLIKVQNIKNASYDLMQEPGEILEAYASEISEILSQSKNKTINDVLKYSIREILRNIVEHSQSEDFRICAQYLPSLGKVNFAVLDRGIGIKNSLSANPKVTINNDLDALEWCVRPGISGKVYPGQKRKPKGEWANSGYGLYMTKNICKLGGSFFISSGDKGIFISEKNKKYFELQTHGTAVNLTIKIDRLFDFDKMLEDFRDNIPKNVFAEPSKSTMSLKSNQNSR